MYEPNLSDKGDSVTEKDSIARLEKFATLATRLDFLDVTTNTLWRHPCHVCHVVKQEKAMSYSGNQRLIGREICLQWLQIVMDEGHLEPSQSLAGTAIGWPKRKIALISLWVDFCCWARKQQIGREKMPEEYFFYELLDRLFIRLDDMYEFPALEKCREAFKLLREANEHY